MLTEEVPFPDLCEGAVVMEVAAHDARPPRPLAACMNGDVGSRVWAVIQNCWKTSPRERPHMSQVLDMLPPSSDPRGGDRRDGVSELFGGDLFETVQELATIRFKESDF